MESRKQNKQNRNKLIDAENKLMVTRDEGVGGMGEKGEGTEKYTLAVTKIATRI